MPRDPESWMWERARAILDEAERIERRFFQLGRPGAKRPSWVPPVDVFETAEALWILVALPGVDDACVEVAIQGSSVVVSGERWLPPAFRRAAVHRLEIPCGRFERRVPLPPGTYELGKREFEHGCLVLGLDKIG